MYVTWNSFTCEVSGSTFRKHRCERCRTVYGYTIHRTVRESSSALYGLGEASARSRAEANAKRAMENELATGFDLVPCLSCGWYQSRMVSLARDEKCRWLSTAWTLCLGACILCVFFVIGIPNETRKRGEVPGKFEETIVFVFSIGAAISLALFGAFYFMYKSRRRELDLNESPVADRIAVAEERGAVIVKLASGKGPLGRAAEWPPQ